ncbi:MAG: VOC family protein [Thermomicrobiales bacterium]
MPENVVPYEVAPHPDLPAFTASSGTHIGHIHLKVSNLDRALAFYQTVLGLEMQERIGDQAAFLSAGGYHHHLGLNTWESLGGNPPPANATGLYHSAIVYGSPEELLAVFERLLAFDIPIAWISDHGTHLAIYLYDPDQNGVELYFDRSPDRWPRDTDGNLQMTTERLTYDGFRERIAAEVL